MRIIFWNYRQLFLYGMIGITLLGIGLISTGKANLVLSKRVDSSIPQPIYHGNRSEAKIALAVNVDQGEEFLPGILEVFDTYQVKSTFFLTGRWAKKFPDLTLNIYNKNHEIGNHGYSYSHPNKISKEKNQEEILSAEKIIQEITGDRTTLFAPPYGEHKPHVLEAAEELGFTTILWTIDLVDLDRDKSSQQILQRVSKHAENGAIVLMHPTNETLDALPLMVKELQAQGFELVTITQLLR